MVKLFDGCLVGNHLVNRDIILEVIKNKKG